MKLPPLWQHQKDAIARAGNKFALFFDPGCGKTRTAIELLKKAQHDQNPYEGIKFKPLVQKILIFAPLNVCRNWQNELAQYLGTPYETYLVAGQSKAHKIKKLEEFAQHEYAWPGFLICNLESLRSKEYRDLLKRSGATFIIVDESHNFKSPTSLQTKGLFEVVTALKPAYLYLLTGTPAPQGEIDLWSTLRLLDKTPYAFFPWRKKYFQDKNERRRGYQNYWPCYEITPQGKAEIHRLLSECSVTAKKNEVLDLPPLLRTEVFAEISAEQKRHYDTMREFLFAIDSEGHELNAANLLTRTLRLQQILAGFLGDVSVKDNPRLKALEFAIEKTLHEQFIIWTIFKATYKQIGELLDSKGISFGLLTGEQSAGERAYTMQDFQNGDLHALIAHPKAGGVGVNLTAASYSINYTRNFSLVDSLQAEARNYRGGSERHERITVVDIITPDTIDEEIVKALREKKSAQDFIMGLQRRRLAA